MSFLAAAIPVSPLSRRLRRDLAATQAVAQASATGVRAGSTPQGIGDNPRNFAAVQAVQDATQVAGFVNEPQNELAAMGPAAPHADAARG
jgi:hypothetical protein